ncbi:hypothetical protein [Embleya sp. NBC_00896]|uniref:hypothetical protein n=1 Tax=Embleya sp. NBC_00896 TaxID=2975961 RepID=UPI00386DB790|nr:hypothetical protein OG928_23600 [Embleya sp. NBC_00896]
MEALETFQGALQGVLADLVDTADSPANSTKYTIGDGDLGVSFAEAPLIGGVLKETAQRLQTLINSLHSEIVSMKQGMKATGENMAATDDDQRRAMSQIEQQLNGGPPPAVGGSAPQTAQVPQTPQVPQVSQADRKVDLG